MSTVTASIEELQSKSKSELSQEELRALELHEFSTGPLSTLSRSVKHRQLVLVSCRNNRKLVGRVKAFDRHCNMVLESVKEVCIHPSINYRHHNNMVPLNHLRSAWILRRFLFL